MTGCRSSTRRTARRSSPASPTRSSVGACPSTGDIGSSGPTPVRSAGSTVSARSSWRGPDDRRRMIGTISDITEQQQLLEALRESEYRLVEAQRIGRLGSWERDIGTGTLRWSDESHRIFGIEPGTFAGTLEAYLAFVHPDDRARAAPRLAELAATDRRVTDYRIVRADGEVRTLHEEAEVIRAPNGTPLRYVGSTQDITEQVAAQAALSVASERRYTAIFEGCDRGDPCRRGAGDAALPWVIRPPALRWLHARAELVGLSVRMSCPRAELPAVSKDAAALALGQDHGRALGPLRRQDGTRLLVDITGRQLSLTGRTATVASSPTSPSSADSRPNGSQARPGHRPGPRRDSHHRTDGADRVRQSGLRTVERARRSGRRRGRSGVLGSAACTGRYGGDAADGLGRRVVERRPRPPRPGSEQTASAEASISAVSMDPDGTVSATSTVVREVTVEQARAAERDRLGSRSRAELRCGRDHRPCRSDRVRQPRLRADLRLSTQRRDRCEPADPQERSSVGRLLSGTVGSPGPR